MGTQTSHRKEVPGNSPRTHSLCRSQLGLKLGSRSMGTTVMVGHPCSQRKPKEPVGAGDQVGCEHSNVHSSGKEEDGLSQHTYLVIPEGLHNLGDVEQNGILQRRNDCDHWV
jgi:hypothetical protein